VTTLGVLVFDTLPGLAIGIVTSILLMLYRASIPHVAVLAQAPGTGGPFVDIKRDPKASEVPGVAILRVESALFFANADAVRDQIRAHAADEHVKAVVIDAETVPTIDGQPVPCCWKWGRSCGPKESPRARARDRPGAGHHRSHRFGVGTRRARELSDRAGGGRRTPRNLSPCGGRRNEGRSRSDRFTERATSQKPRERRRFG
jgi:MFS superfamily sulfate permease-like transporter